VKDLEYAPGLRRRDIRPGSVPTDNIRKAGI